MAPKNNPTGDTSDREIMVSRVFNAPRELVWRAMTDPQHVVHWWGPGGFTTTIEKMDVRPGGVWQHTMHGPDGTDYPNRSVFKEVVEPERIVYSHGGRRAGGPGVSFVATWTFEAVAPNQTRLTGRMVFPSAADRDFVAREFGAVEGAHQTFARLAEYLPKVQAAPGEVVIARVFDAPRQLVWRAWTDPKHLAQWWGPAGFTNPVCNLDVRLGGMIHIIMRGPNGVDYPMAGSYREVVAPEKLVYTSGALDQMGKMMFELLHTVTFVERAGRTTLTVRSQIIQTTEGADRYTNGYKAGMTQSLARLASLLAKS
jgi:uncharacterized protein YndB with AHSA1/START domain